MSRTNSRGRAFVYASQGGTAAIETRIQMFIKTHEGGFRLCSCGLNRQVTIVNNQKYD
ncbi:MAG: hypothetical protein WBA39_18225 [Rivularia sp. (in: cyanobacteria)]